MSVDNAIDHLAEEIEEIEHINPWGRVFRWIAGIGIVAAFIAWIVWIVMSPPGANTSSAKRMGYIPSNMTSIEMVEPIGATLNEAPLRFQWESVTGKFQYIVRVYERGASAPIFERAATTPSFELTPDERGKLPKGKAYVWTVVAQGKDGSTIAAGQSTFKVR